MTMVQFDSVIYFISRKFLIEIQILLNMCVNNVAILSFCEQNIL
jgi:hypothetical protein